MSRYLFPSHTASALELFTSVSTMSMSCHLCLSVWWISRVPVAVAFGGTIHYLHVVSSCRVDGVAAYMVGITWNCWGWICCRFWWGWQGGGCECECGLTYHLDVAGMLFALNMSSQWGTLIYRARFVRRICQGTILRLILLSLDGLLVN